MISDPNVRSSYYIIFGQSGIYIYTGMRRQNETKQIKIYIEIIKRNKDKEERQIKQIKDCVFIREIEQEKAGERKGGKKERKIPRLKNN